MPGRLLIVTIVLFVLASPARAEPVASCDGSFLIAAGPPVTGPGGMDEARKVRRAGPRVNVRGLIVRGNKVNPKPGYRIVAQPGNRAVLMMGDTAVGELKCSCAAGTGEKKGTCNKVTKQNEVECKKETCGGTCFSFLEPFPKGSVGPAPGGQIAK